MLILKRGDEMELRVREMIDALDDYELEKLMKDLKKGGVHLKALVKQKIRERQKSHSAKCAICQSEIDPYSTSNYTLLFGPEDLKKKASFCGIDCLEYFLRQLKETRRMLRGDKQDERL